MSFDKEPYPSWQRAGEYLVDSDRAYIGRYESGSPRVYLEEAGTLYPLKKLTRSGSTQESWHTESDATQLALSILFDATWGDVELVETLYHRFALDVISGLPEQGWRLRRDFVWAWIRMTLC